MTRVLITGADGFTGRHLCALLAKEGHEIHGLLQASPSLPVEGMTFQHVADLTDEASAASVVAKVAPEKVVHLAGIAFVADRDIRTMYSVNLIGTLNLLEALSGQPRTPSTVLLASSANVYGNASSGALDESAPTAPANHYAVSKLAMEHLSRLYMARLPVVICRPFNYTGVGQSEAFLLPKIVAHSRRGATEIELGNLDVARDFSDVRDVVSIYGRLLDAEDAIGQTINVCSGAAHTLREILALVEAISGVRLRVSINPALVRPSEVKSLMGNRGKLDALLPASSDHIPLAETLSWMMRAQAS